MSPPATVLVVDDEPNVRDLLSATLRLSGFDVHTVGDSAAALTMAMAFPPDVMVMNAVLPDGDGFALARRLRNGHDSAFSQPSAEPFGPRVPVLFLAARDSIAERIAGLTAGGDDYVTKPFSPEEIVLRLRTILRRARRAPGTKGDWDGQLTYADLTLDEDAHEVRRAGRIVELSPTEFNLLRYLMVNAEKVVSKTQILDRVWNYDYDGDSRIVESYISYLRKKIDNQGRPLIQTIRGIGYSLR
ncbi:MAG TPA: response regulator transcription factor [Pseudonocardiaceae bacterium]|jgi:two-component system OmpR family response regulator